ncbi:DUF262 domain-containing protein [Cytophagaceae bacterium ABcell3]|nr:DUF262 domain-containing protein [Cytophagaceae bacterium ABcell3]
MLENAHLNNIQEMEQGIDSNLCDGFEEEREDDDYVITTPFDPKQVDITVEPSTVSKLVDRMRHDEINLFPEFQRKGNLWDRTRMSQLIESILIQLPLPAFYVDVADDDKWIVVDGLQRLSTLKKFIIEKQLKLKNLEFLKSLDNKGFDEIGRVLQRRIDETQVTLFKIRKGTPKKVLTSLFHRINTGGLKLTSQEIRHALNQGPGSQFLVATSEQDWFKRYIKVSDKRMLGQELILRFCAFFRQGYGNYQPSLQIFLDDEMEYLNEKSNDEERNRLQESFKKSLELSFELLGEKMFSKALISSEKKVVINRSLFEATTVNLAQLSQEESEMLVMNKNGFKNDYTELLKDVAFDTSITANTSLKHNVNIRHKEIQEIIKKHTDHAY